MSPFAAIPSAAVPPSSFALITSVPLPATETTAITEAVDGAFARMMQLAMYGHAPKGNPLGEVGSTDLSAAHDDPTNTEIDPVDMALLIGAPLPLWTQSLAGPSPALDLGTTVAAEVSHADIRATALLSATGIAIGQSPTSTETMAAAAPAAGLPSSMWGAMEGTGDSASLVDGGAPSSHESILPVDGTSHEVAGSARAAADSASATHRVFPVSQWGQAAVKEPIAGGTNDREPDMSSLSTRSSLDPEFAPPIALDRPLDGKSVREGLDKGLSPNGAVNRAYGEQIMSSGMVAPLDNQESDAVVLLDKISQNVPDFDPFEAEVENGGSQDVDVDSALPPAGTDSRIEPSSGPVRSVTDTARGHVDQVVLKQVADALIQNRANGAQDRSTDLEIRLDPPHLGRVRIQLRADETGISAKISAAQSVTRASLEEVLPQLRSALDHAGVNLNGLDVTAWNFGDAHGSSQDRWESASTPGNSGPPASAHLASGVRQSSSTYLSDSARIDVLA